jgi:hypothetical protein
MEEKREEREIGHGGEERGERDWVLGGEKGEREREREKKIA